MPNDTPRLLIVDDEAINIRVLHQILKDDYVLLMATGGAEALDVCRRERPALVLLDIMMPGMDGLETCRRLQAMPAFEAPPVIFVTAQSSEEEAAAGLRAGAVDFITKPVQPSLVRARVATHLLLGAQTRRLRAIAGS
ncbi:response regulator [Solimonas marina]|uniref:Response regulator n=1 Tax=Solimonas marina TaxID=2714601 RepID=A0A970B406_9GAMM|nr:response regulator [Solimonas marina]NKF21832.1 response regulator [Solimonas marina]